MDSKPLITVIVPVYNSEKYLCQCVDSIFESDLYQFGSYSS